MFYSIYYYKYNYYNDYYYYYYYCNFFNRTFFLEFLQARQGPRTVNLWELLETDFTHA